jgi:hypothetical protein
MFIFFTVLISSILIYLRAVLTAKLLRAWVRVKTSSFLCYFLLQKMFWILTAFGLEQWDLVDSSILTMGSSFQRDCNNRISVPLRL